MITISRREVAGLVALDLMAELHQIREKLACYERKFGLSYDQAVAQAKGGEQFERDDDLMEWKAYLQLEKDRLARLEDVRHERFRVA